MHDRGMGPQARPEGVGRAHQRQVPDLGPARGGAQVAAREVLRLRGRRAGGGGHDPRNPRLLDPEAAVGGRRGPRPEGGGHSGHVQGPAARPFGHGRRSVLHHLAAARGGGQALPADRHPARDILPADGRRPGRPAIPAPPVALAVLLLALPALRLSRPTSPSNRGAGGAARAPAAAASPAAWRRAPTASVSAASPRRRPRRTPPPPGWQGKDIRAPSRSATASTAS